MAEAIMAAAHFDLSCRNADDGCTFETSDASEMKVHESTCEMGRVPCLEEGECKAR